ncbi:MAG: hypothetical protein V1778_02900 [bacterium]
MPTPRPSQWPLLISLLLFSLLVVGFLCIVLVENNGHIVYVVDDAYIHLAMAKTYATTGVWGILPSLPAATSSSILWTLLLALGTLLAHANTALPFVLNIFIAVAVLWLLEHLLRSIGISPVVRMTVLCAIVLFALPLEVVLGMEHGLHILLTLAFVFVASKRGAKSFWWDRILLAALAFGLLLTRLEGIFLLCAAGLLFLSRNEWKRLLATIAGTVCALTIVAGVSFSVSGIPLPLTIVVKALTQVQTAQYLPSRIADIIHVLPFVPSLVLVALFLLLSRVRKQWHLGRSGSLLLLFVVTATLHILFALNHPEMRYQTYLGVFGIVVLTGPLVEFVRQSSKNPMSFFRKILHVFVPEVLALFLCVSITANMIVIVKGTHDIYLQQYQMADFAAKYYPQEVIAINDIGLVSTVRHAPVIDVVGLANNDITSLRIHHRYTPETLRVVTSKSHVRMAALYIEWLCNGMIYTSCATPEGWIEVAEWTVPPTTVLGGKTVAFFALGEENKDYLIASLAAFSQHLPKDVTIRWIP